MIKRLLLLSSLGLSTPALCADYQGIVTSVQASGGKVLIRMGNGTGTGLCSTPPVFYLDPAVEYDKIMLTLALSAKLSGLLTYVAASGTCETAWPLNGAQKLQDIDLKG